MFVSFTTILCQSVILLALAQTLIASAHLNSTEKMHRLQRNMKRSVSSDKIIFLTFRRNNDKSTLILRKSISKLQPHMCISLNKTNRYKFFILNHPGHCLLSSAKNTHLFVVNDPIKVKIYEIRKITNLEKIFFVKINNYFEVFFLYFFFFFCVVYF